MRWANFFHIYQPAGWDEAVIRRVADESYRPLLSILERHPDVHITLHIAGALTEQFLALGMNDFVDRLRHLVDQGQVELVGGAMYHPILPLLPVAEIDRQISLQETLHRRVFGPAYQPRGFFAPEMAYGPALEQLLIDRGYQWIILDEIAYAGTLGSVPAQTKYATGGGLGIVYRHRRLSDYLAFLADVDRPDEAVQTMLADPHGPHGFITAMDGEILGHHRHGVDRLWEMLVVRPEVEAVTVSALRDQASHEAISNPVASSWSSQPTELAFSIPYGLWCHPQNPIHDAQWRLTTLVTEAVESHPNDPAYDQARRRLDQQLSSDKYWWASASPWWDPNIVIRETQKLAGIVDCLTTLPQSTTNAANRLMSDVATTARQWDSTGLAKRRQGSYLQETGAVRYMAGSKVSS